MFTDTIKDATLPNHQQVEKLLVGRMKSMRSKQDYVDLLGIFYSYFGGLEIQLKPYINGDILVDYTERRKTEAIADDLQSLGSTVTVVVGGDELPQITNKLQALGALYVIEGSTLGGQIISQMIQRQLGINGESGLAFFNGYGNQTQQMWEKFKNALNQAVKSEADATTALMAANETFSKFKQWIEKPAIVSS